MAKQDRFGRWMRWSEATTFKFVSLYKDHSILWDIGDPNYRCKDLRDAAYNSIVSAMGIAGFGVPEAKQKVKNLQSTYTGELKKISISKKNPIVRGEMSGVLEYVPTLKWFPMMDSIWKNIREKKDLKAKTTMADLANRGQVEEKTMVPKIKTEEVEEPALEFPSMCEVSIHETEVDSPPPPKQRKIFMEVPPNLKETVDAMKSVTELVGSRDECSVYGEHIANRLRTCGRSSLEVAIAQHRIDQVLFSLVMGEYAGDAVVGRNSTDQATRPPKDPLDTEGLRSGGPKDTPQDPLAYGGRKGLAKKADFSNSVRKNCEDLLIDPLATAGLSADGPLSPLRDPLTDPLAVDSPASSAQFDYS